MPATARAFARPWGGCSLKPSSRKAVPGLRHGPFDYLERAARSEHPRAGKGLPKHDQGPRITRGDTSVSDTYQCTDGECAAEIQIDNDRNDFTGVQAEMMSEGWAKNPGGYGWLCPEHAVTG